MKRNTQTTSRLFSAIAICLLLAQAVTAAPTEQQIQNCREKPTHKQQIKCACELGGGTFQDFGSDWGEDYACTLRDGWTYWCTNVVVALRCRWVSPDLIAPDAAGWLVTGPQEVTTDGVEPNAPPANPWGLPNLNGDDLVIVETDDGQGEFQDAPEALLAIDGVGWLPPDTDPNDDPFAHLADAPLEYLEGLLEWQQEGIIRADAPIAYYIDLRLAELDPTDTNDPAEANTDENQDAHPEETETPVNNASTSTNGEPTAFQLAPSACGATGFGMFALPLLALCCAARSRRPQANGSRRNRARVMPE